MFRRYAVVMMAECLFDRDQWPDVMDLVERAVLKECECDECGQKHSGTVLVATRDDYYFENEYVFDWILKQS